MKKMILRLAMLYMVFIIISTESCKCNRGGPNAPVCPTCDVNEVCVDGICQCKEGCEKLWGRCQWKTKIGSKNGWDYTYIADQGCFSFDSTVIRLGADFFKHYVVFDSTNVVFGEEWLFVRKHCLFPRYTYTTILEQNAMVYKDSLGLGLRFRLGNDEKAMFEWYTVHGKVWTEWDCRFTADLQKMDAKVVLVYDLNWDYRPETRTDSCIIHYTLW